MSFQQQQLIQHSYCDTCFSEFTCGNCTYYGYPCLNCDIHGHICSLNCEPLPKYPGPQFPPGLPKPPVYSFYEIYSSSDSSSDSSSGTESTIESTIDFSSGTESSYESTIEFSSDGSDGSDGSYLRTDSGYGTNSIN